MQTFRNRKISSIKTCIIDGGDLGPARLETLTIDHGRHTLSCHALAGDRTLAQVHDATGHANVSIINGYLHVAVDDEKNVGNLFRFE